jgi:hypothetical protein
MAILIDKYADSLKDIGLWSRRSSEDSERKRSKQEFVAYRTDVLFFFSFR